MNISVVTVIVLGQIGVLMVQHKVTSEQKILMMQQLACYGRIRSRRNILELRKILFSTDEADLRISTN